MAFPATPIDATVSLAIGADIHADPATWSWTDVTALIRESQKININRGRRSRIGQVVATRCSATADNTDGNLCRHNPLGTHFGVLRKNTPMRVQINNGSGYVTRAAVFVPGFPPSWDPSEQDQTVTLHGVGLLDRIGRGRVLRSAMYRSTVGVAPNDYVPYLYHPMEDGTGATQFASGLPGGAAMTFVGGVTLASDDSIPGSSALPVFDTATTPRARSHVTVPAYTETGQWVVSVAVKTTALVAALEVYTPTGVSIKTQVYVDLTANTLRVEMYDAVPNSGSLVNVSDSFDPTLVSGQPVFVTVGSTQNTGGGNDSVNVTLLSAGGAELASISTVTGVGYHGMMSEYWVGGFQNADTTFGHAVSFIDPAFVIGTDEVNNAQALGGWVGEMAHDRMERLCREARIRFTTTATTSAAMGPQLPSTLLVNLRDAANADLGILYESMDFGLAYLAASQRTNITAAITLQYDQGHILPPWEPDDDDQDYFNDVTATKPDGSPSRSADEDNIDDVGSYGLSANPNVQTGEQAANVSGWLLHQGLNDELTWPSVRPNLLLGGALLDAWLATDIGELLYVTGHPSPLAPDTIRQIVEGYTETYGSFTASASAILSPASVWDVAELDDDSLGKLDTAGCVMQAAATSGATSFTVATTVVPKWTTDAGEMPIPILVPGQVNSVTAVANVAPSFVAAGAVAHAVNASVTPTMPAGVQAGDLLLVWAAIRNSGTGTVNTPAGYTALLTSGNVGLYGKVHTGTEVAPTVSFTGGAANADTSAQMAAFRGTGITVHASSGQLNGSAQDITYPAVNISRADCVVLYLGWKADDWTSVATIAGATEIDEPDTTTGDDQGIVWDYVIQTTATPIVSGTFVVTGGASAISRGAVVALATDVQTMTVTRGTNGVTKAIAIGSPVNVYIPARLAL